MSAAASPPQDDEHSKKCDEDEVCQQKNIHGLFQIALNAGPDPLLQYTWHVRRWEINSGFDPITQDLEYMTQQFSAQAAEKVRFRHAFGRALDPILLKLAKPFCKVAQKGIVLRKNYCLPGDIQFSSVDRIRGIFRITLGVDNKIIHKFFTKMSSSELIEKYQQEGTFAMDVDEGDVSPDNDPHHHATLPDDGSRVVHVCHECIQVQCKNGELLTVAPFQLE